MIQINEEARCTVVVNMDDKGSSCNNARMMIINPSNTPNLPIIIFKKMNIYILHNILLIILLTFPMNRSIPAFSPTSASLPFACAEIPMIYYQH